MRKKVIHEHQGVFVSVFVDGLLRGCIGTIEPDDVQKSIIRNAIAAAYHDSRFPLISHSELERLEIHISLLTVPKPFTYLNEADLLQGIKGKGVIISYGHQRATFLPVVWRDLPDSASFLQHLCLKADLGMDAWKKKGIKVSVYESEEFSS